MTKFRFRIDRTGRLSGTGVRFMDGRLEFGEMRNGSTAFAETASGKIEVTIRNRAIVDPPPADRTRMMLAIEEPPCPIEELEGALLIGAEETTNNSIFCAARTEKK